MSQPASVPVNPAVMRWAREFLGVSIDEAAARLKQSPAVIVAWAGCFSSPLAMRSRKRHESGGLADATIAKCDKHPVWSSRRSFR